MEDNLRKQIRESMSIKETEELLDIWRTNDRVEWSDTAFDEIEMILEERIGELPPQDNPILERTNVEEKEDPLDKLNLDEWEEKLLDSPDQPDFYDTVEVIGFRRTVDKAAKAAVYLSIISGVLTLPTAKQIMNGYLPTFAELPSMLLVLTTTAVGVAISIVIYYYPLKALAHIIRILMEMEFNSRIEK